MKKKAKGTAKAKARKPMSAAALRDLELMHPAAKQIRGGRRNPERPVKLGPRPS
ncbi:MAG: hypothetical protein ACREM3_05235 [Candidatus Rokuibacteriota bacterium]